MTTTVRTGDRSNLRMADLTRRQPAATRLMNVKLPGNFVDTTDRMAQELDTTITAVVIARGMRCENLERLTFSDASFDLHVTQDVLEHIFDPDAAFKEIARTLKPGGMHIFTGPLVNQARPSEVCARRRADGTIEHLREPEYHDNLVSSEGALLTYRWGDDICDFICSASGLFTQMVFIDALDLGFRGECIEVLITRKPVSQMNWGLRTLKS